MTNLINYDVIPKASLIRFIAKELPIAKAIINVPITQAIKAFLAIPVFSGLPAEVRYKIPVITQPITTIGVAASTATVETFVTISFKVNPKATRGEATATVEKVKNNIFLFTPLEICLYMIY